MSPDYGRARHEEVMSVNKRSFASQERTRSHVRTWPGPSNPAGLLPIFQDRGMVHEPVDSCQRHGLVGENLAPFAEGLVGRNEQRSAFIASSDQLEQHTGLGLIPPTRITRVRDTVLAPKRK
jgi:hypothetical protein